MTHNNADSINFTLDELRRDLPTVEIESHKIVSWIEALRLAVNRSEPMFAARVSLELENVLAQGITIARAERSNAELADRKNPQP